MINKVTGLNPLEYQKYRDIYYGFDKKHTPEDVLDAIYKEYTYYSQIQHRINLANPFLRFLRWPLKKYYDELLNIEIYDVILKNRRYTRVIEQIVDERKLAKHPDIILQKKLKDA